MAQGLKITDTDKGFKALFKVLDKAAKPRTLEVGILTGAAGKPHNTGSGKPLTIGEIAEKNEYGIGMPERSFIRSWADSEQGQNLTLLRALGRQVLSGKIDPDVALERAGMRFAARIQERMAAGIPPPNSPETIRRKKSSTPLIDKGVLRSSISYSVKGGAPKKGPEPVGGAGAISALKASIGKKLKRLEKAAKRVQKLDDKATKALAKFGAKTRKRVGKFLKQSKRRKRAKA